jgi:hypothetical protein
MMNRIKTGIISLAVALGATVMVIMPTSQPEEVHADPTGVIALNSASCVALGIAFGGLESVPAISACTNFAGLQNPSGGIQQYVKCLRAKDVPTVLDPVVDAAKIAQGYPNPVPKDGVRQCGEGVEQDPVTSLVHPTPADFAPLDLDANQVHFGQQLYIIAFVDDDASVRFKTDEGVFAESGGASYICVTEDPDCDGDESTVGDGVVVATLAVPVDLEPGTYSLVAIHEGIGWPVDFTVTGTPDEITLEPLFGKPNLSVGATPATPATVLNPDDIEAGDGLWDTIPGPPADPTDCNFAATVDGVLGANSSAEKMVIVAKAFDSDGNEVAGALLDWNLVFASAAPIPGFTEVSDTLAVAVPVTPTLDTGALGIGFPQFVCGLDEPGTVTLTARFSNQPLDPQADLDETTSIDITVLPEPANLSLAVDPPSLACDGTAAASVTATVTTADGDPVANGTDIPWSVQVLGTVSPLSGDTADGKATANVVPFAGANVGVPVIARVGDLVASTLVQCGAGSAPPVPGATPPGGGTAPGSGAPGGTVRPPDTGTGGDLDGRAALNVWGAVALFAGAMGLIGARLALRRID